MEEEEEEEEEDGAGVGGFGCVPFGQGQPTPDILIVPQTSLSAIFM